LISPKSSLSDTVAINAPVIIIESGVHILPTYDAAEIIATGIGTFNANNKIPITHGIVPKLKIIVLIFKTILLRI
jgi:hypothetical protein